MRIQRPYVPDEPRKVGVSPGFALTGLAILMAPTVVLLISGLLVDGPLQPLAWMFMAVSMGWFGTCQWEHVRAGHTSPMFGAFWVALAVAWVIASLINVAQYAA